MLIPQHQSTKAKELFRVCETGAGPNLPLAGDFHPQTVMIKAIKLISCDIQRNCISSFENLHVIHVFIREYSVDIVAKNDFDPWIT